MGLDDAIDPGHHIIIRIRETGIYIADNGTIPKGSCLLVESLARLSRQDVYKAFGQFSDRLDPQVDLNLRTFNFSFDNNHTNACMCSSQGLHQGYLILFSTN